MRLRLAGARLVVAGSVVLAATGCVSLKRSAPARYFVLRAAAEAPAAPGGERALLVGVLPALLPGFLERSQIVSWTGATELRIDETARWGEPLDAGVTRTLAENLAALLPGARVLRSPWSGRADPRCRVRLEVSVFGPQPGGEVRLAGRFVLLPSRGEGPLLDRAVDLRAPSAGGAPGEVEAMSVLLARLSAAVAAAVRELPDPS